MILLLFNERNEWNYTDIAERTNLEEKELKRTLQSLSVAKVRPIRKQPHVVYKYFQPKDVMLGQLMILAHTLRFRFGLAES